MVILNSNSKQVKNPALADFSAMRWLALTSLLVIVAIPYWMMLSHEIMHAVLTLIVLVSSMVSVAVYILYHSIVPESPTTMKVANATSFYLSNRPNPLNFWFPITFLILHMISVFFMIKQISSIPRNKTEPSRGGSRAGEPQQMSVFLAPS